VNLGRRIPCAIIADTWASSTLGAGFSIRQLPSRPPSRLIVDRGAESTWIDAELLEAIGIERRKKDLQFQLANGQIVTRSVGYAVLRVDKAETVDEVVFAQRGDLQLLVARALEGLNLQVDSRRKRLVAAGPIVSAAAVPPRFGQLVQVPPRAPRFRVDFQTAASPLIFGSSKHTFRIRLVSSVS